MNWQEVCEDPSLQNLPYKIELDRYGQILMSPASNEHGYFQNEIGALLRSLTDEGRVITECSVDTTEGTKVADVSWGSPAFFAEQGLVTPLPKAPEICVEIISPSNSKEQMEIKAALYFEAGAKEVWFCRPEGKMEFRKGKDCLTTSGIVPSFPSQVG